MSDKCAFCTLPQGRIRHANALAVAIDDAYPISLGHSLIIPRRHIASLFETTEDEREALWELLHAVRAKLSASSNPDGFNVGVNDGVAAGQTVMHLHVHLVPRYTGDKPDPRGGVRWIFPDKADYWSKR